MNIDQFYGYETDQVSTKSNSDSHLSQNTPNRIAKHHSHKPVLAMSNTKNIMMKNTHFSSILKQLRPNLLTVSQEKHQQYLREEKDIQIDGDNSNRYHQVKQSNPIPIWNHHSNPQNNQFHPSPVFNQAQMTNAQNLSPPGSFGWVTSERNVRAFDIKSNPFNFCQSIQQEEPDE